MRLRVQKLGRIENAEIALAPLTIFFGKNGTQKTWTAHAYFKLLEAYRVRGTTAAPVVPDAIDEAVARVMPDWLERVAANPSSEIEFTLTRQDLLDTIPSVITTSLRGPDFRSVLGTALPPATLVELEIPKAELLAGVGDELQVTASAKRTKLDLLFTFADPHDEPDLWNVFPEDPQRMASRIRGAVRDLAMAWRYQVHALPSERVHLVQSYPRLLQDKDIVMPHALADFCQLMAAGFANRTVSPQGDFARDLVRAIGGELVRGEQEILFAPLEFAPLEDTRPYLGSHHGFVPIQAAASLVKSMAGLSVFLASARRGDAIVIDEPEMNTHPEAQVALMELFAAMVRRGMHVLLITHSPYIVDHAGALVESSRVDPQDRKTIRAKLAPTLGDVYLRPNELAIYEFEGGRVREVFDQKTLAIDWSTFTDINDRESRFMSELVAHEVDDAP